MSLGIDEDWAKVNPAAYDGDFIVGYISEDNTGKNLTPQQIQAIHAARKDVGLVYEFNPQSALLGAPEGHRTAAVAISHAQFVNAPHGMCLYNASFDFNIQPSQFAVCDDYLFSYVTDVHRAGYLAGPYSGFNYIQHAGQANLGDYYWQTYAWSLDATGHVKWSPYAVLRQYENGVYVAGATVDLDETTTVQWGQWKWNEDQMTVYQFACSDGPVTMPGALYAGVPGAGWHWLRDPGDVAGIASLTTVDTSHFASPITMEEANTLFGPYRDWQPQGVLAVGTTLTVTKTS